MHYPVLLIACLLLLSGSGLSQYPPAYSSQMMAEAEASPMKRVYLTPQRIVWKSDDSLVVHAERLLEKGNSQASFQNRKIIKIINRGNTPSGLILDFGKEIHGGLQLTTTQGNNITRKIRIRFGESVSETCSEAMDAPKGKDSSTNHHSLRDFSLTLPGYGSMEVGNTGYRFVRIDLLDPNTFLSLQEIRAIATFRDIPYTGSFRCNDEQLNRIWLTGAYTVHLNMQDYLVDGIKRDRMVWAGDLHPEVMTINSVFGYNEVVPKSLDFLRNNTPLPRFMNGISSYSMWWVIIQHNWYQAHGKLDYLKEQKNYLISLLDLLTGFADEEGRERFDSVGLPFIDWPVNSNKPAVKAAGQGLLAIALEKGAALCTILGAPVKAAAYRARAASIRKQVPETFQAKEVATMLSLAGMMDAGRANDVIAAGGPKGFSAFFGYYMLLAQAKAGDYAGALDNIRRFWGGMLDLGATTFWEEFDLAEAAGAARIDSFITDKSTDYHCTTGTDCYIGLRRSLCHGWSAGPTPWLTEQVLGITVLEPGCKKISIKPHLADLQWAEGRFPTPMGTLYVKHTRLANGKINSLIKAPKGVTIIR